jgi:hypothetical protein
MPQFGFSGGTEDLRLLLKWLPDKCHNMRNLGEHECLLGVDDRLDSYRIAATQLVADATGKLS